MESAQKYEKLFNFSDYDKSTMEYLSKLMEPQAKILKLVEPYITYGPPNLKTVRELVYKRGHARVGRDRVALTTNTIIHDHLGRIGVHCMEDIIHEIYTCGSNFKKSK